MNGGATMIPAAVAATGGWLRCLSAAILAAGLTALLGSRMATAGDGKPAVLEFIEPADGGIFSTLDEIPVALRAFAPGDAFFSAEVKVDGRVLATAQYCCPMCPCPKPPDGQETTLRIPVPWNGGTPPKNPWQGWRPGHPGIYRLTATAIGRNGTVLESAVLTITVIDLNLRISVGSDGGVILVLPQGSLVSGGFDLEASDDLTVWARLGPFQPGAIAAFYYDTPPAETRRRYYRAVRLAAGPR